jgi:uncharacterized lipoprotein YmbA
MPYPRIHRMLPGLFGICLCTLLLNGCSLIFPPRIDTYALHVDPLTGSEIDSSFTGTIWLREFDIVDEFNTNRFVYRDPNTQRIHASKHFEWPGMASDAAGNLAFRYLSQRFAGHVQLSITPPADYIIEGRVEDMSIDRNGTKAPQTVSFELYYEIEQKSGQSYSNSLAVRDTAIVKVAGQKKENVANAMALAIQTVARRIGDHLLAVSEARTRRK